MKNKQTPAPALSFLITPVLYMEFLDGNGRGPLQQDNNYCMYLIDEAKPSLSPYHYVLYLLLIYTVQYMQGLKGYRGSVLRAVQDVTYILSREGRRVSTVGKKQTPRENVRKLQVYGESFDGLSSALRRQLKIYCQRNTLPGT